MRWPAFKKEKGREMEGERRSVRKARWRAVCKREKEEVTYTWTLGAGKILSRRRGQTEKGGETVTWKRVPDWCK